jgi:hypothetical protein
MTFPKIKERRERERLYVAYKYIATKGLKGQKYK